MLPAKLFAGLTLSSSVLAGLAWIFAPPSADMSAPHLALGGNVFFAIGPALVPLFCAVTSLNLAVLYFAAVRIFRAEWNRTLSFLHFALTVVAAVSGSIVYPVAAHYGNRATGGESALGWVFVSVVLGILCFIVSYVVFAMNLLSVAVQLVRARLTAR